jgi:hypothetical protein
MAANWRVRLLLLSFVILLLAGFGSSWAVIYAMHRSAEEAFQPHMAEYLAAAKGTADPAEVKGKMVVVDKATRDIDWDVFFGLPDDVRAAAPQEVGTVVWLVWDKMQVGKYNDGTPAYSWTCAVTVIDQAGRGVVATTSLRGSDPPEKIENPNEGVGTKPTAQVIDYLRGLPRQ